jgi:flagellar biosynthesis protein FlhB
VYGHRRPVSDKTEDPTPRRLLSAREKGDVAVSGFASQSLGFLVAVCLDRKSVV